MAATLDKIAKNTGETCHLLMLVTPNGGSKAAYELARAFVCHLLMLVTPNGGAFSYVAARCIRACHLLMLVTPNGGKKAALSYLFGKMPLADVSNTEWREENP